MEKKGGRETVEDECLGDNIHYPEIDCPPKTYPFPRRLFPRRHTSATPVAPQFYIYHVQYNVVPN